MQDRLNIVTRELETKELMFRQIEIEKRDNNRKYEALDLANFELQERLSIAESRAEEFERENLSLNQKILNLSCTQKSRSQFNLTSFPAPESSKQIRISDMIQDEDMLLLESDGIKLIDFDKQMKQKFIQQPCLVRT